MTSEPGGFDPSQTSTLGTSTSARLAGSDANYRSSHDTSIWCSFTLQKNNDTNHATTPPAPSHSHNLTTHPTWTWNILPITFVGFLFVLVHFERYLPGGHYTTCRVRRVTPLPRAEVELRQVPGASPERRRPPGRDLCRGIL